MRSRSKPANIAWLISICFCLAALAAPTPATAQGTPSQRPAPAVPVAKPGDIALGNSPVLVVGPDGKATAPLLLANHSGAAVTASFGINKIQSSLTHAFTTPQTITFDGSATGQIAVPAEGKTVILSITSTAWQPGRNLATLTEGATPIGTVKVENLRASLQDIKLPDEPFDVNAEKSNQLAFTNKGNLVFPLMWRLVANGTASQWQKLILGAQETRLSPLPHVPSDWVGTTFFEDAEIQGAVELNLQEGVEPPISSLPLKVHVMRSFWREFWAIASIFGLIFAGALFSYFVNLAIPSLWRVANVKSEVMQLSHRVSGVSDRIDSRLRVLIASELNHLMDRARARLAWLSPSFPETYASNMDALGSLKSRLDHVETLDDLRARYDLATVTFPPQTLAVIDCELQAAADLLRQLRPTQGDLENARRKLEDASVKLDSALSSADTGKTLSDEAKRLWQGFAVIQDQIIQMDVLDLIQALTMFPKSTTQQAGAKQEVVTWSPLEHAKPESEFLKKLEDFSNTGISPGNYATVGLQLYKLSLLLEYLRLVANVDPHGKAEQHTAIASPIDPASRTLLSQRLQEEHSCFLEKLRLNCWEAMQSARRLLSELQCNTFPADLRKEIEAFPQRVEIKTNPPVPQPDEPTELFVSFYRAEYERSAARDELFCTWNFGSSPNGPVEKGWTVWHFFPCGDHEVKVTIRTGAGQVLKPKNASEGHAKEHEVLKPKNPSYGQAKEDPTLSKVLSLRSTRWNITGNHRLWIEILQFLVSLLVVVAALMAGAIQKIENQNSLTIIATLFGLGFAANTVKNLITPPASKP